MPLVRSATTWLESLSSDETNFDESSPKITSAFGTEIPDWLREAEATLEVDEIPDWLVAAKCDDFDQLLSDDFILVPARLPVFATPDLRTPVLERLVPVSPRNLTATAGTSISTVHFSAYAPQ